MEAKYDGFCKRCRGSIEAGSQISKLNGVWGHTECPQPTVELHNEDAPQQPRRQVMASRFFSTCKECEEPIVAGGMIEKKNGIWVHETCPEVPVGPDISEVPSGRYAIGEKGSAVYLVVDNLLDKRAGWNAGTVQVKQLLDHTNSNRAPGGRQIRFGRHANRYVGPFVAEMTEILQDPAAAVLRFGAQTERCGACGTQLTDPKSITRSMGPVCVKRFARWMKPAVVAA